MIHYMIILGVKVRGTKVRGANLLVLHFITIFPFTLCTTLKHFAIYLLKLLDAAVCQIFSDQIFMLYNKQSDITHMHAHLWH